MMEREPDIAELGRRLGQRLLREAEQRHAKRRARRQRLREQARELARRLVEEYGAEAVWLIGSLAGQGGIVHERSDIDLVVKGIPEADEWSLGGDFEAVVGAPVDIVILERAPASFHDTLAEIGERLDVP